MATVTITRSAVSPSGAKVRLTASGAISASRWYEVSNIAGRIVDREQFMLDAIALALEGLTPAQKSVLIAAGISISIAQAV